MADIDIIGVPMDLGSDRRGVDMGPSALRCTGLAGVLRRLGHTVVDSGNLGVAGPEQESADMDQARYVEAIARVCRDLGDKVNGAVAAGMIPLVLGGDHSIAMGTALGLAGAKGSFGVLWIDAHADVNTPQTSPSGNVHGMPLAASMGLEPASLMRPHVNLSDSPPIRPEHVVLLGARDIDPGERDLLHRYGIKVYTMADIDRRGVAAAIDESLAYLQSRSDHVYVSFDLDALDPAVAPGVGTPKDGGLTYREGHLIMETIAASRSLCALEVVEVNPILDDANRTARVACELNASAFGASVM